MQHSTLWTFPVVKPLIVGHGERRYKKGCTTLKLGDCPTFFPLPSLTPGSEAGLTDQMRADMPNWVHKVCRTILLASELHSSKSVSNIVVVDR